jgi:hypothetical protein
MYGAHFAFVDVLGNKKNPGDPRLLLLVGVVKAKGKGKRVT